MPWNSTTTRQLDPWESPALEPERTLLVDGLYGTNVPLRFANNHDLDQWGVDQVDQQILLAGPEHPDYWETWDTVLDTASFEQDGKTYRLYQDNDDLFAEEVAQDKEEGEQG